MADKKPRTPTPPRVQAPQRRTAGPDDMGARHRAALYGFAATGLVGLVAVVLAIVFFGGGSHNKVNDAGVGSLMAKAGCSFKTVKASVPSGQGTHVASLTANDHWNTTPPSNGQHFPSWAVWGFYTQTVNPRRVVHNEEHGGVILWWGAQVPSSTVGRLQSFYNEQPVGTFGTPYPALGSKIAITAWTGDPSRYQKKGYYGFGHIGICPGYTPAVAKAFEAFRTAYRGKGPEGMPLAQDAPGLGP